MSEVGSRITREGLPLTAVMALHASAAEMGVLAATGGIAVLLFGLFAGVIVDRVHRRPVMIGADLGRAALLGCVPLLAVLHSLRFSYLIAIAAAAGILTVLFDVAYQSFLPSVVEPENLLDGNRLLSISSSTAEVVGPSLTGVLVQLMTAPLAILVDALSFLVSAASVWAIRSPEKVMRVEKRPPFWDETLAGFEAIWAHRTLRALFLRSVMAYLSMGAVFAFYILYAIQILHFQPSSLGLMIALGGAGGLIGGTFAGRISARLGTRTSFLATALVAGVTQLCLPLASVSTRWAIPLVCIQQFVGDMAMTVYMVNEMALRQTVTPGHVLGRVNAAMQLGTRGMLPIGALVSGFLADRIGMTNMLWIGMGGALLSLGWLLPLWGDNREADTQL